MRLKGERRASLHRCDRLTAGCCAAVGSRLSHMSFEASPSLYTAYFDVLNGPHCVGTELCSTPERAVMCLKGETRYQLRSGGRSSPVDKSSLLSRHVHRTQSAPYYMSNGSQSVYVRMYRNTTLVSNNRQ